MSSVNDGIAAYWDEYADAYDAEPDHGLGDPATREAWRLLLERWLPAQPSDVADLACGTGSLTALVAGLGHRVMGVDLAGNMVESRQGQDRAVRRARHDQAGRRVGAADRAGQC